MLSNDRRAARPRGHRRSPNEGSGRRRDAPRRLVARGRELRLGMSAEDAEASDTQRDRRRPPIDAASSPSTSSTPSSSRAGTRCSSTRATDGAVRTLGGRRAARSPRVSRTARATVSDHTARRSREAAPRLDAEPWRPARPGLELLEQQRRARMAVAEREKVPRDGRGARSRGPPEDLEHRRRGERGPRAVPRPHSAVSRTAGHRARRPGCAATGGTLTAAIVVGGVAVCRPKGVTPRLPLPSRRRSAASSCAARARGSRGSCASA